jgi:hypothetical protein
VFTEVRSFPAVPILTAHLPPRLSTTINRSLGYVKNGFGCNLFKGLSHEIETAKSYVAECICIRRGAAGGFKNFQMLLRLLVNVNRNAALQRKGMKIAIF